MTDRDEKMIQGFKREDFRNATPDRVFGEGAGVTAEAIPEGVRLFLKNKSVDLDTKTLIVRVYRIFDAGGLKERKELAAKVENVIPEEEHIAEMCGPGSYIRIARWKTPSGVEGGIMTDPIYIGEDWRPVHEAWKRKQAGGPDSIPATPASVPQAAASPLGSIESILALMAASEQKTLTMVERIMALSHNSKQSDAPADVLAQAYKGANEMIMSSVRMAQGMAKTVVDKTREDLERNEGIDDDDDDEGAEAGGASDPTPDWLKPFMPKVKEYLGTLLAGGPMGSAVKTLIVSSEQWKEIFSDPEKFAEATTAMEAEFGSERTAAALDVLLNRRKKKPAAPAAPPAKSSKKGKGR